MTGNNTFFDVHGLIRSNGFQNNPTERLISPKCFISTSLGLYPQTDIMFFPKVGLSQECSEDQSSSPEALTFKIEEGIEWA